MSDQNPKSTASIAGHPIHPMLVTFPIAFLISALVADLVFLATGTPGWATAALWLLGAGVAMGLFAAVFGFIDFAGERRIRALGHAWQHMIGNLIAVAVACANWYLRYRAGGAPGVPSYGVWLSLLTVAILAFTGWKGGDLVYRHRVGVREADRLPPG